MKRHDHLPTPPIPERVARPITRDPDSYGPPPRFQPITPRPVVGQIELQDSNGRVLGSYDYHIPVRLRARELYTPQGVFTQFAQTVTGMWVYRYMGPLEGRPTDPFLRNWRAQE